MKTRKTKIEIIEELFDNYYCVHPEKRSINTEVGCMYMDPDTGNRCAVGMCMEEDGGFFGFIGDVSDLDDKLSDTGQTLDDILKGEYRGHDKKFWSALQHLHDGSYWTKEGLTEKGEQHLKYFKRNFKE